MKYLKLFEDYKTAEDIEDILQPLIDDKWCHIDGGEHFKEMTPTSYNFYDEIINRLKKFNVDNYLSMRSICWFSKEIEEYIINKISNCQIVTIGNTYYWSNFSTI